MWHLNTYLDPGFREVYPHGQFLSEKHVGVVRLVEGSFQLF